MRRYGLIGKDISYSFSKSYFSKKFETEKLTDCHYDNYDIPNIEAFQSILRDTEHLKGLNVTIPYKEAVIPYLDTLSKKAREIGAVNTIKISKKGKLKGYNTDYYGFKKSIEPFLRPDHDKALILGTGGASKAIAYALEKLGVAVRFVSRHPRSEKMISYEAINPEFISSYSIIINCTPLGTYPNVSECPAIPYKALSEKHLLYDLIYNPEETEFLIRGRKQGAVTCNGSEMLRLQAEKSWQIWN